MMTIENLIIIMIIIPQPWIRSESGAPHYRDSTAIVKVSEIHPLQCPTPIFLSENLMVSINPVAFWVINTEDRKFPLQYSKPCSEYSGDRGLRFRFRSRSRSCFFSFDFDSSSCFDFDPDSLLCFDFDPAVSISISIPQFRSCCFDFDPSVSILLFRFRSCCSISISVSFDFDPSVSILLLYLRTGAFSVETMGCRL